MFYPTTLRLKIFYVYSVIYLFVQDSQENNGLTIVEVYLTAEQDQYESCDPRVVQQMLQPTLGSSNLLAAAAVHDQHQPTSVPSRP